jgi:hypothetical protein
MTNSFSGKAWKYGDHIDTDVIIPARYLVSSDERSGKYCMEDIDKDFVRNMSKGDMIAPGNFGCDPPGSTPPSPSRRAAYPASSPPPSPGSFTGTPSTWGFPSSSAPRLPRPSRQEMK